MPGNSHSLPLFLSIFQSRSQFNDWLQTQCPSGLPRLLAQTLLPSADPLSPVCLHQTASEKAENTLASTILTQKAGRAKQLETGFQKDKMLPHCKGGNWQVKFSSSVPGLDYSVVALI